jgi:Zn-finger nucleic acid-binding protein
MPYLNCPSCHLTVYSAASWSHVDDCPRCGTRLGDPGRLFRQVLSVRRSGKRAESRVTGEAHGDPSPTDP